MKVLNIPKVKKYTSPLIQAQHVVLVSGGGQLKSRQKAPHWRNPKAIKERYLRLCERLHLSSDFFSLNLETKDGLAMSFRKDPYKVKQRQAMFGKNIIITDNMDWTTGAIIEASLDRW